MLDQMPRSAEITNQADSGEISAALPVKRVVRRVPEIAHTAEASELVEPGLVLQFRPKRANRLTPVGAKGEDSDHADSIVDSRWSVDPDRVAANWPVGRHGFKSRNLRVKDAGQLEGQSHQLRLCMRRVTNSHGFALLV